MNFTEQHLYQIALTLVPGVGDITARNLLKHFGTAENVFKSGKKCLLDIKGLPYKLADEILNPEVLHLAEKELAFAKKNNIEIHFMDDDTYPHRLRECSDAPILIYSKGNVNFNTEKVISIVGTRNSTNYGNQFCDKFIEEIYTRFPDALIISGLAYGIDINAHRSALKYNLSTIGVLAHGLDRIYPHTHRQTAVDMLANGGLLTEFPSKTEPDRFNFVRRNRIVAGMADAVIVVESNAKGGSLITADIANSYCKDVFAVPGRQSDVRSEGCNKLIADHKADILLSTDYFIQQMGWGEELSKQQKAPRQKELFVDLSSDEQKIIDVLSKANLHVDQLASESQIPTYQLFSILLELEMKGIVLALPGSSYALA